MTNLNNLNTARAEVSASSAGGAPFLLAFGLTLLLTGIAALYLPLRTAAIVLLFQGNAALPSPSGWRGEWPPAACRRPIR